MFERHIVVFYRLKLRSHMDIFIFPELFSFVLMIYTKMKILISRVPKNINTLLST